MKDLEMAKWEMKILENAVVVAHLSNTFDSQVIHDDIDFSVRIGEVMGILGGSGSGKSVLLRTLLGLHKPKSGSITILGQNVTAFRESDRQHLQKQCGVLFQSGALFGSLTVLENIMVPLVEIARVPHKMAEDLACFRLQLVGLSRSVGFKYPSELSGGMVKRVALARALAIDPKILFLDEPTSGLDPIAASEFDQLVLSLQENLNLTVVMVSHDLESVHSICDRVSVLVDKKIITGTLAEIQGYPHPWVQAYFKGNRAQQKNLRQG